MSAEDSKRQKWVPVMWCQLNQKWEQNDRGCGGGGDEARQSKRKVNLEEVV